MGSDHPLVVLLTARKEQPAASLMLSLPLSVSLSLIICLPLVNLLLHDPVSHSHSVPAMCRSMTPKVMCWPIPRQCWSYLSATRTTPSSTLMTTSTTAQETTLTVAQERSVCCACAELRTVFKDADSQHQAGEPAEAAGVGLHNVTVTAQPTLRIQPGHCPNERPLAACGSWALHQHEVFTGLQCGLSAAVNLSRAQALPPETSSASCGHACAAPVKTHLQRHEPEDLPSVLSTTTCC